MTEDAFSDLPKELVNDPWKSIFNYYEEVFPNAGGKVFMFASLQAISAFAPKFEIKGREKRIATNIMLIGNSGSGKTELMESVEEITPKSYHISTVTDAVLEYDMETQGKEGVTLIVNDLQRVLNDQDLIKAFEALIGDGRVDRKNMVNNAEAKDLDISMIGGAVPSDISKKIGGGFLFRVVPIKIQYNVEQNGTGEERDEEEEVGRKIVMGAGNKAEVPVNEADIKRYYDTLYKVIEGEAQGHKMPVGYDIDKEHSMKIFEQWNYLRKEKGWRHKDINWFRELIDGFRFACLSAVLNIPNREKVNLEDEPYKCKIRLTEKDAKIGANLMKLEMGVKWKWAKSNMMDDLEELSNLSEPSDVKGIIDNLR